MFKNYTWLLPAISCLFGTLIPADAFLKKWRHVAEPATEEINTIVRAQIFLDENNFGPGKIDGQLGQFTRIALAHYNHVHGLAPDN